MKMNFKILIAAIYFILITYLKIVNSACQFLDNNAVCSNLKSDKIIKENLDKFSKVDNLKISGSFFPLMWSYICKLTHLKELDISYNNITDIPRDCFKYFDKLLKLDIVCNELEHLKSQAFDGLVNIVSLNLSLNFIRHIDVDVFISTNAFKRVSSISLSKNKLTTLGPWPLMMRSVNKISIDLRYNLIQFFTNDVNFSFNCKDKQRNYIDLRKNSIKHLSEIFVNWTDDISKVICSNTPLNFLDTAGSYACDCVDYSIIRAVIASKSNFLDDKSCMSNRIRLVSIPMNEMECEIKHLCPENCSCKQKPHTRSVVVSCSNAAYESIPPGDLPSLIPLTPFSDFHLKYDLYFNKNLLTSFNLSEHVFNDTKILDLSENKINEISPHTWVQLIQVEDSVFLHNNNLSYLPRILEKMNITSKRVTLHGNPWSCTCQNAWMLDWLKSHVHVVKPEKMVCAYPEWHESKSLFEVDFCYSPPSNAAIISCVTVGIVVLIVAVTYVWYRLRFGPQKTKDPPVPPNPKLTNDVFIFCSDEEQVPLVKEIIRWLENEHRFSTICGLRDFDSKPKVVNINEALTTSKRIIFIVSKDFLKDNWCISGTMSAFSLVEDKRRFIVIFCGVHLQSTNIPVELEIYIRTYTYLSFTSMDDESFWKKLLRAMPKERSSTTFNNETSFIEN
ncbi:hypothetical protein HELRODRAFT_191266 [Helobdella robusta]|uniref:TIR domain-containing protein n=1 Tax=Helobdella robusta TaxID=6412 RepID=T1FST4_HELRO|nr:hypothetical protein HELRODRAFT_191266 [Helobdella robusta]ESO06970.1 hypothetical protein HELRODRAFT_191266 [Helobdella robusta]